jgi:hypothetical protein
VLHLFARFLKPLAQFGYLVIRLVIDWRCHVSASRQCDQQLAIVPSPRLQTTAACERSHRIDRLA